ncbi:OLC1v1002111C1 [Oldenlandia corymbosa var. corymbosa]|nr:OLC1v1002111C1 [Oldenlandia corymbosa var. corymbosa]
MRVESYGSFKQQDPVYYLYECTKIGTLKISKLRFRESILFHERTQLMSSCGGFLIFGSERRCYFLNPVTQEHFAVDCPSSGLYCIFCGFFYHSSRNEFKVLYATGVPGNSFCYYIYTLGTNNWRMINPPPFPYAPVIVAPWDPAVCNGFLHWMAGWLFADFSPDPPHACGILVFEMNSEEFSVRPHPGHKECSDKVNHWTMSLLVNDEQHLVFCNLEGQMGLIDIWMLEDHASWFWVRKWKLNLCTFDLPVRPLVVYIKPLLIHNGVLWLDCWERGLLLHNLERNNVRRVRGPPWSPFVALGLRSVSHSCIAYARSHLLLPKSM